MKQRYLLAGVALIGISSGIYLSPIASLGLLLHAANQGNNKRMQELVDFNGIKKSMNQQIKIKAEEQLTNSLGGRNIFSEGIASIAMLAVNPIVESKVSESISPEGLKAAIEGMQNNNSNNNKQEISTNYLNIIKQLTTIRLNYKSPKQAFIILANPIKIEAHNNKISLEMQRKNLVQWQLVDINLNL